MKFKVISIELGGVFYVIPPLALGDLEAMQDQLAEWKGDMSPQSITTVVDATFAALKRNYPDITRADVAALVDLGNMADVMESVMDVAGLKRKSLQEPAPGEAQPVAA